MNAKRLAVAAVVLIVAIGCRNHERTITGSYGNGVASGQVVMAASMSNGSPTGVQVSVQGTGMTAVLSEDGRFTFVGVPGNAVLHFSRAADGIDAVANVTGASMAVELSAKAAVSGRRRSAPVAPLLQFEGTVNSVTSDTLVVATSFKTDVTVKLTADTVIRKGQTTLTPADLKKGDRIHVKTSLKDTVYTATEVILQDDNQTETGDDGQSVTANGIVSSIGTNQMVVHRANGQDVTVKVDGKTLIRKYGQSIAFSDIKVGDHVESRGTAVDSTTILAQQIEVEDAPARHESAEVSGTVTAVGASSLTVHSDDGDVTVNTDANTTIRKQGKKISLSDVHTGDGVNVQGSRVDASTILAQTIEVHSSGHH